MRDVVDDTQAIKELVNDLRDITPKITDEMNKEGGGLYVCKRANSSGTNQGSTRSTSSFCRMVRCLNLFV